MTTVRDAFFEVARQLRLTSYPKKGVEFLESLTLSSEDKAKIAHQNADRLFKLSLVEVTGETSGPGFRRCGDMGW